MAVDNVFKQAGYIPENVDLGEVDLEEDLNDHEMENIGKELHKLGFEVIDDAKSRIIEKIKNIVVRQIHHSDGEPVLPSRNILSTKRLKE